MRAPAQRLACTLRPLRVFFLQLRSADKKLQGERMDLDKVVQEQLEAYRKVLRSVVYLFTYRIIR